MPIVVGVILVSPGAPALAIPPDLATCDDCARELDDPRSRRFGYAFTTCAAKSALRSRCCCHRAVNYFSRTELNHI